MTDTHHCNIQTEIPSHSRTAHVMGQGPLNIHPIFGSKGWRRFHFRGMIESVSGVLSWTMEGNVMDKGGPRGCFGRIGCQEEPVFGEAATCCSRVFFMGGKLQQ